MLRGTHHDPDLSRPEVHPEQCCCVQQPASSSGLSRSKSHSLITARQPSLKPRRSGAFFMAGVMWDPTDWISNVQTKPPRPRRCRLLCLLQCRRPRIQLACQQCKHNNHRTNLISPNWTASLNQRLIRLIDPAKSFSRTAKIGMVLLHQFAVRLLDLDYRSVGVQPQNS